MIIGNRSHISFELIDSDVLQAYVRLDFYLGNKLITNELVYVPTYIASFERFIELLNSGQFEELTLVGLSLEKRFEKLVNERESNESQFFKYLFQIDETTDQYTVFVFSSNDLVHIVWACWDEHNCNEEHQLNKIYSVSFPMKELTLTLYKLISHQSLGSAE